MGRGKKIVECITGISSFIILPFLFEEEKSFVYLICMSGYKSSFD